MLTLVTAATSEPVTVEEAKRDLRVTHSSDDTLIASLITAAREKVELATGRSLVAASYAWAAPSEWTRLPLRPIGAITAATYASGSGRVALPAYTLDAERGEITLDAPQQLADVNVEFTTAAPTAIPEALKAAIRLFVVDLYDGNNEPNARSDALLAPYRETMGL